MNNAESALAIDALSEFEGEVVLAPVVATAFLARKHSLSAYDASYLAVAVENKAVLATIDKGLAAAARVERCFLNDVSFLRTAKRVRKIAS